MDVLTNILAAPSFWGLLTPVAGGVVAWLVNEHSKRKWDQHAKREQRYVAVLNAAEGFYVSADDPRTMRQQFIRELSLTWLYCPDDVIRAAYRFLESVKVGAQDSDEIKELRFGELVVSIRKDLINPKLVRQTALSATDYKHLMIT